MNIHPPAITYTYIVSSEDGFFVKFDNDNPLMDSDPLRATRMTKIQAKEVVERLDSLGFASVVGFGRPELAIGQV